MIKDYLNRKRNIFASTTLNTLGSKLKTLYKLGFEPQISFDKLKEAGYSLYTIRQYFIIASRYEIEMLNTSKFKTWLQSNNHVFRNVYQRKSTLPTETEIKIVINNAPTHDLKNALTLMAYAGLRISEVENAAWSDLDGNVLIVRGKGGKIRRVPLPNKIVEFLRQDYNKNIPSSDLTLQSSSKIAGVASRRHIIHKYLAKNLPSAIPSFTAHDLRAFYISDLLNNHGFSVSEVRELVGHSSIATTDKYSRVNERDLARKLEERVG